RRGHRLLLEAPAARASAPLRAWRPCLLSAPARPARGLASELSIRHGRCPALQAIPCPRVAAEALVPGPPRLPWAPSPDAGPHASRLMRPLAPGCGAPPGEAARLRSGADALPLGRRLHRFVRPDYPYCVGPAR